MVFAINPARAINQLTNQPGNFGLSTQLGQTNKLLGMKRAPAQGALPPLGPQEMEQLRALLIQFLSSLLQQLQGQQGNGMRSAFSRSCGNGPGSLAMRAGGARGWDGNPGIAGGGFQRAVATPQTNRFAGIPALSNGTRMSVNPQNGLMLAANRNSMPAFPNVGVHNRALIHAREDIGRINNLAPMITRYAQQYNIPPAILAGLVSRETRGRNVIGDNGHGHGLGQIDDRSFPRWTRRWRANGRPAGEGLRKASEVFDAKRRYLRARFPQMNEQQLLKSTLSAYNAGEGAVARAIRRGRDTDSVTTGRDYGRDVLNRASVFAQQNPAWMPRH